MRTDIHNVIMTHYGTGNPFWFTDTRLMNAMIFEGWARRSLRTPGMIELTDRAETYAQKEKAWLSRGNVA